MFPWLWIWAPQLHFPLSGSVAQEIDPTLFFAAIKPGAGNGRIEKQAFDVASYGKQLGLITDVLIELAERAEPLAKSAEALTRLRKIRDGIEAIKNADARDSATDIAATLQRLRRTDPQAYARLREQLAPLLAASV
jgi:hypothetical protein